MEPIPETGGGPAGFVAYLLWHVYRHLPSPGHSDWVWLCFFLATLVRLAFLPYLWHAVKEDVASVLEHRPVRTTRHHGVFLWDSSCIFLLTCLFYTNAGRTFLAGREWFGLPPWKAYPGVGILFLVLQGCVLGLLAILIGGLPRKMRPRGEDEALAAENGEEPVPPRLLSFRLFGVAALEDRGEVIVGDVGSLIVAELVTLFLTHLFSFWFFPIVVLVLFFAFAVSSVLIEVFRMVFFWIQYRSVSNSASRDG